MPQSELHGVIEYSVTELHGVIEYSVTQCGPWLGVRFIGPAGRRIERMTGSTVADGKYHDQAQRIIREAFTNSANNRIATADAGGDRYAPWVPLRDLREDLWNEIERADGKDREQLAMFHKAVNMADKKARGDFELKDDCRYAALLAVAESIRDYDPEHESGTPFEAYATKNVKRRLSSERARSLKRRSQNIQFVPSVDGGLSDPDWLVTHRRQGRDGASARAHRLFRDRAILRHAIRYEYGGDLRDLGLSTMKKWLKQQYAVGRIDPVVALPAALEIIEAKIAKLPPVEDDPPVAESEPSPLGQLIRNEEIDERNRMIQLGLSVLDEDELHTIFLVFGYGCPLRRAGYAMNRLAHSTLQSRVARILAKMRVAMEQPVVEPKTAVKKWKRAKVKAWFDSLVELPDPKISSYRTM